METLKEKIARVTKEEVDVVPYDPNWPRFFEEEKQHLLGCLPSDLARRIEHHADAGNVVEIRRNVDDVTERHAAVGVDRSRRRVFDEIGIANVDPLQLPTTQ